MSTEALDLLDEALHCSICTLPYDEYGHKPKALPCLHTCCLTCLNRHVQVALNYNKFPCPFCRTMTTMPPRGGVNKFPDNFYLRQMVDIRQTRTPSPTHSAPCDVCTSGSHDTSIHDEHDAVKICLDCGIRLCETCADRHHMLPVTKDHTLRDLSSKNLPCKEHPNATYQYYCEAHMECICITCYQVSHSDCSVKTINEAAVEKMNYLRQLNNRCEGNERMLQEQLDACSVHVADLEQQLLEARTTQQALAFSLKQFTPSDIGGDTQGAEQQLHLLENYPKLEEKLTRLSELQCYEDLTKFVIFKHQFGGDLVGPIDIVVLSNSVTVAAETTQNSFKIYDKAGSLNISCSTQHCSSDSIRSRLTAKDGRFIRAYSMYDKLYLEMWNSEGGVTSLRELHGNSHRSIGDISPSGIAVAPDGTIVIGDTLGGIHIFSHDGQFMQTLHTTQINDMDIPHQNYIVINQQGHIFFSDIYESCVKVYSLDGDLLHTFGSYGSKLGELRKPNGMCLWEQNIIIADYRNNRVCMFTQDGKFLTNLVTDITGPTSVAIREKNELVICSNHSEDSYELLVYNLELVV